MKTTLDYALEYCHKHYSVIPLVSKDKKPAINSWELNKTARADEKQIVQWFSNSENNIAIVTGRISSIIAFDIDGDAAKEQFFQRVEAFNDDSIKAAVKNAMRIRTGSGNTNIIIGFKPEDFAEGEEIKNAVLWGDNSNGGHSEIRLEAEGGYIVAPPSTHPNGNKYELVDGVSPAVLSKEQIQKLIVAFNDDDKEKSYSSHNNTNMFYQLNDKEVADIVFVLKPYYHFGKRHDLVLYLSGWLRKKSVAIESANKVIQHIAEGDDEKSKRFRTLEETYAKEDLGSIKGYSGLLATLTDLLQGDKKNASNILKKVIMILSAHRHLKQQLQGEGHDEEEEEEQPSIIEEASEAIRCTYNFATIAESKDILYYKDGVYIPGGEVLIEKEAEKLFGYELSNKDLAEIKGHIMRKTYRSRTEFDADLYILNLKNGLYNILTAEFNPHTPDYLSVNQIPILYKPDAESKHFGKYLKEVLYPTDIRTAVELMAYTFYRDNPFEIITVLFGYGANGKSVFTGLLTSLHGANNISNVPLNAMIKNTFALSDLENKDINIDTELSSAMIHDSAILKKLTGRQPIRIERKNQRAYDALLHAKLFLVQIKYLNLPMIQMRIIEEILFCPFLINLKEIKKIKIC
jgi:hypothetical protein